MEQTTSCPSFIDSNYNADILKRAGQCILVIRENISSFTFAQLVPDEKAITLKNTMLKMLADLLYKCGPEMIVRADPGSSWRSLLNDKELIEKGIKLQLGHEKFQNKNCVVDKAITELHAEINKIHQSNHKINELILAESLSNLNSRIRSTGLSAKEIWFQRDQFTGQQLPLDDRNIIQNKYKERIKSHHPSARYQARGKEQGLYTYVKKGDLVYLNSERDKTKPRDRYIVVDNKGEDLKVQKFVGSQIRSRIYTVKKGDIIKVNEHKFSPVYQYSDTSDDDVWVDEGKDSNENAVLNANHLAPNQEQDQTGPRRSSRTRRPPSRYDDFIMTNNDEVFDDSDQPPPCRSSYVGPHSQQ